MRGAARLKRLARRLLGGPQAIVLMYHRVSAPAVDPWRLAVPADTFEEQITDVAATCEVVHLGDLPQYVAGGRRGRPVVAVTFDDGYRDNLTVAKPILERRQCPATVFIATGSIGSPYGFWWDELAGLALETPLPPTLRLATSAGEFNWTSAGDGDTAASRAELLQALWDLLRRLQADERADCMAGLAARFGSSRECDPDAKPMTADEIRRLRGPLLEIGAHTVTHPPLTMLPLHEKRREIAESRRDCEAILGTPVQLFAYPYGDVDAECRSAAAAAGISLAVTTEAAAYVCGDDVLAIPRLQVPGDWSGADLVKRIHTLAFI